MQLWAALPSNVVLVVARRVAHVRVVLCQERDLLTRVRRCNMRLVTCSITNMNITRATRTYLLLVLARTEIPAVNRAPNGHRDVERIATEGLARLDGAAGGRQKAAGKEMRGVVSVRADSPALAIRHTLTYPK